jgi:hypothetical protein
MLEIEPGADTIGSVEFYVDFDVTRLQFQSAEDATVGPDAANGWVVSAHLDAPGQLRMGVYSTRGDTLSAGLHELLELSFRVLDSTDHETTPIRIEPLDARAYGLAWTGDQQTISIAAAVEPHLVTSCNVSASADVNRDGFVTALDVLLLINHIHTERHSSSLLDRSDGFEPFCDVDNDGQLTEADILAVIDKVNAQVELQSTGEERSTKAVEDWFANDDPDVVPTELDAVLDEILTAPSG